MGLVLVNDAGLTTDERKRLKELEREKFELRRAQRDFYVGVGIFCAGGAQLSSSGDREEIVPESGPGG